MAIVQIDEGSAPAQAGRPEGEYKLLGDQPFRGEPDPLGFDEVATHLIDLVFRAPGSRSRPFTLGIEGTWGTGKSSLMQRMERRLDTLGTEEVRGTGKGLLQRTRPRLAARRSITTVWFNAWAVEEGKALEGLIKSVLERLDSNLLRRLARKRQLLGWAKVAVTVVGRVFGFASIVDSIWAAFETDPKARNDLQKLMRETMCAWMKKRPTLPQGRVMIVFIDDLDRCTPVNVFQVFEAIKIHLNTDGLVFVIGYDKDVISEAVLKQKQYRSIRSGDYLEKIIQVSYRMPRASDDTANSLIDSYLTESRTMTLFSDPTLKDLVVQRNARNPRRIKRFINAFILEWGLDPEWLEQQFDPGVVVRVVILYLYFAEFAALLETPSDDDPVEKFERYLEMRRILLWGQPSPDDTQSWQGVNSFIDEYDLPPLASSRRDDPLSVLKTLEQELPPCFEQLARQAGFVQLVGGLGDREDRERLRVKLQRRRPSLAESRVSVDDLRKLPRWDIKTLTDSAASKINLTPREATIAELIALEAPNELKGRADEEFDTYRVSGTIVAATLLSSADVSMVISDSGHTMLIRSVSPTVAQDSPAASQIAAVRQAVVAHFPNLSPRRQMVELRVTVTGVGFFDRQHGQFGVAPNGFELRPILSFEPTAGGG